MIVHWITILASLMLSAITLAMPSVADDGIGESITGKAEILGPDMIAINQQLIFLFGVDAPEERQPCFDEKRKMWNCAVAAGKTLLDLVGDFDVTCMRMAPDWRRRMYGVCTANNKTINEEMVRAGMAMMIREETLDYETAENEARTAPRGLWRGVFDKPWLFRLTVSGQGQPLRKPAKVPPPIKTR